MYLHNTNEVQIVYYVWSNPFEDTMILNGSLYRIEHILFIIYEILSQWKGVATVASIF